MKNRQSNPIGSRNSQIKFPNKAKFTALLHGAENVWHGAKNVRHCAKNERHGAKIFFTCCRKCLAWCQKCADKNLKASAWTAPLGSGKNYKVI